MPKRSPPAPSEALSFARLIASIREGGASLTLAAAGLGVREGDAGEALDMPEAPTMAISRAVAPRAARTRPYRWFIELPLPQGTIRAEANRSRAGLSIQEAEKRSSATS